MPYYGLIEDFRIPFGLLKFNNNHFIYFVEFVYDNKRNLIMVRS